MPVFPVATKQRVVDKFSLIFCGLPVLLLSWSTGGCTINIYRTPVSSANPVTASSTASPLENKDLLVNPELAVPLTSSKSKVSEFQRKGGKNRLVPAEKIITMQTSGSDQNGAIELMDTVELDIVSQVDAYLNCYYQQADDAIVKIFPNRYSTRYWIYAGQRIALPDNTRYAIVADSPNVSEGFLCLVSSEDILSQLPEAYRANSFQTLPVRNFDAMFELYKKNSSKNLVARSVFYVIDE